MYLSITSFITSRPQTLCPLTGAFFGKIMALLKTDVDHMPDEVKDFIAKLLSIKQTCDISLAATDALNVLDTYRVCTIALAEVLAIEAKHTLVGLRPYLEDHTKEADWSIYNAEYVNITTVTVPAWITFVEANVSVFTVASMVNGAPVWTAFTGPQITSIQSKLNDILADFA